MTVEEKAKAYDEALEVMRQWVAPCHTKEQLDTMKKSVFPELRENEDEMIRKEIINYLDFAESHNLLRAADYEKKKRWIAYLEKQKEQKSIESIAAEVTKDKESAIKFLKSAGIMDDNGELAEMYRSEPKPAENDTRTKIISRATSEKQVVLVSESSGKAEISWDTRSLEDAKKLLEYGLAFINKQLGVKPAEWSEEDEERIQSILFSIGYCKEEYPNKKDYSKDINWLKSLRPQPHYKPSEEQEESEYYQHFDPDC